MTLSKAKVEAAVLIVERWILARLRNQRFYSLAELNAAMGALDPEEAKLFVHWRDSDAVDYVMVPSRHNTTMKPPVEMGQSGRRPIRQCH